MLPPSCKYLRNAISMPDLLEISQRFILSYKAKICAFLSLRIVKVLYAQCEARSSQYSRTPAVKVLDNPMVRETNILDGEVAGIVVCANLYHPSAKKRCG